MRHSTFKFCLDPTVGQSRALARHAGASRFAYNTNLRLMKRALGAKRRDESMKVPWSGFDLINSFNRWKKTEAAGRVFAVDTNGDAEQAEAGLPWRAEVCQQVFEEAAVDLGKALAAFSASKKGDRKGRKAGFPRMKRKSKCFATVSRRGGRWWVSLNVEAADLHLARRHDPGTAGDSAWVGIDRGLCVFAVAATSGGVEVERIPARGDPGKSAWSTAGSRQAKRVRHAVASTTI